MSDTEQQDINDVQHSVSGAEDLPQTVQHSVQDHDNVNDSVINKFDIHQVKMEFVSDPRIGNDTASMEISHPYIDSAGALGYQEYTASAQISNKPSKSHGALTVKELLRRKKMGHHVGPEAYGKVSKIQRNTVREIRKMGECIPPETYGNVNPTSQSPIQKKKKKKTVGNEKQEEKLAASREKVPNGLSCCHTKRRIGW